MVEAVLEVAQLLRVQVEMVDLEVEEDLIKLAEMELLLKEMMVVMVLVLHQIMVLLVVVEKVLLVEMLPLLLLFLVMVEMEKLIQ